MYLFYFSLSYFCKFKNADYFYLRFLFYYILLIYLIHFIYIPNLTLFHLIIFL